MYEVIKFKKGLFRKPYYQIFYPNHYLATRYNDLEEAQKVCLLKNNVIKASQFRVFKDKNNRYYICEKSNSYNIGDDLDNFLDEVGVHYQKDPTENLIKCLTAIKIDIKDAGITKTVHKYYNSEQSPSVTIYSRENGMDEDTACLILAKLNAYLIVEENRNSAVPITCK